MMLDFPLWKKIMVVLICAAFALFALPNILDKTPQWLPSRTVNLGLDLQGGSHLLLQLDVAHYLTEQRENLAGDIRSALRENKLQYRNIRPVGEAVQFTVPKDSADYDALQTIIRKMDSRMELEEVAGAADRYAVHFSRQALVQMQKDLLEQSIEIVGRRVNETGTREPIIQRQGDDRILVQVPGLDNPERLKELLGKTAKMTFHLVDTQVNPVAGERPPLGVRFLPSDDPTETLDNGAPYLYAVKSRVELSGDLLTGATATYEQGQPVVAFKFNNKGARKFGKITQENEGKPFAIVLDGKVITAPRINGPILAGSGIISGNFSVESANDLAVLLRAGALPAPLKVIEERSVGPSLGADSVAAGKNASLLALALIILAMPLMYRRFGVYASIALGVNMVLIMGALSLLQATLTLPGIAGIVLTFGMAVDANVLIFERIREELGHGKSVRAAVEQGFESAFGTIMDSNITTLIAAILLFYFGSGSVKGFAVTLSIGIISSMFSAILLTRMMVYSWVNRARPKTLKV